jgi:hypothetical protein
MADTTTAPPWPCVALYHSRAEAEVARGRLEAAGIAAVLVDRGGFGTGILVPRKQPPLRLLVRPSEARAATELLADFAASYPPDEGDRWCEEGFED